MVIANGAWHRVGFAWDGSTRRLYADGVRAAEDTQTGLAESRGGLNIGAGNGMAVGTFFSGLIDEVRVYSRMVRP